MPVHWANGSNQQGFEVLFVDGAGAEAAMRASDIPITSETTPMKFTSGKYDPEQNILHLWFPQRVVLTDAATVEEFFREVTHEWIDRCPTPPYLLVNYKNLHIVPAATQHYATTIGSFQSKIIATFRYAVSADLTGVAVSMGNLSISRPANVFADEAEARAAIAAFRQREPR